MILDTFRVEVQNDISELRSNVERDMSTFYSKVDHEMAESRAELCKSRTKLREHRADLRNGLAKVSKILAELQASSSIHNAHLLSLRQQSGEVTILAPEPHIPVAPIIRAHTVSTPPGSSVISNTSSTSSVPHIGTLMLDSPTTHSVPSLLVSGPLGHSRDRSAIQHKSMAILEFCRDYGATYHTATLVPGQMLCASSNQSGVASMPPSRAPSRALSAGGSRGESLSHT